MSKLATKVLLTIMILTLTLGIYVVAHRSAQATSFSALVDFDLDKEIYRPGDQVTASVNSPLVNGSLLIIDLIDGNSDRRIFHASKTMQIPKNEEVITDYGKDVGRSANSVITTFSLPNSPGTYFYQLKITVYVPKDQGLGYSTFTGRSLIFTNEDVQKVFVRNAKVDTGHYQPGESIPVSFEVKDGHGDDVKWARPSVTLCNEDKSFCPATNLVSSSSVYSVNFGIPLMAPPGNYQMTISPGISPSESPYAFKGESVTIDGIRIEGQSATSQPMEIAQFFDYNETNSHIPPEFNHDGRLTYGQSLELTSIQEPLLNYGGEQVNVPLENVTVNFQILDPTGKTVFNESRMVDQNGRIANLTFPITQDLKRGSYELYHRPTKDGIDFHSGLERWTFQITDMQKIIVSIPNQQKEAIYFDSRDFNVTGFSYNKESKSLSLQVENNHLYNQPHYDPFNNGDGFAYISIPKHLLSDPMDVKIGDRMVDFSTLETPYYFSAELNQTEIVSPLLAGAEYKDSEGQSSRTLVAIGPLYGDIGNFTLKLIGIGDRNLDDENTHFRNLVNFKQVGFSSDGSNMINETEVGSYSYLSALIKNPFEIDIPYTAIIEVRNASNGVTEFLGSANGTIGAYSPSTGEGSDSIAIPWKPDYAGNYEMHLFLVSNDLNNTPNILTNVSTAEIMVVPAH